MRGPMALRTCEVERRTRGRQSKPGTDMSVLALCTNTNHSFRSGNGALTDFAPDRRAHQYVGRVFQFEFQLID